MTKQIKQYVRDKFEKYSSQVSSKSTPSISEDQLISFLEETTKDKKIIKRIKNEFPYGDSVSSSTSSINKTTLEYYLNII